MAHNYGKIGAFIQTIKLLVLVLGIYLSSWCSLLGKKNLWERSFGDHSVPAEKWHRQDGVKYQI